MAVASADPVVEQGLLLYRLMQAEPVRGRSFLAGKLMELALEHPRLKLPLFRFIDVLPSLYDARQVERHFREYFLDDGVALPRLPAALLTGVVAGVPAALTAGLVRQAAVQLSRSFIAGTSPQAALPVLRRRWREGYRVSVDLLGEAAVSEAEADVYRDRYLQAVEVLARERAADPADGAPRLSLSVKPSSLYSRIGPVNHEDSLERVKHRLRPIVRAVMQAGGQLYLDMETVNLKELTIELFTGLLAEPEFAGWDQAGIALQAYLVSAEADVRKLVEWARSHRRRINIRLVKGAYWESERALAAQRGWPLPVYAAKSQTDACYERCLELLLAQPAQIGLAVASHNLRSIACALVAAERWQVPAGRCEFQALYGMAEPVKRALIRLGCPVREYVPVGEPIAGMAYLVRRLLENSSNEGFLRRVAGRVPPEQLLEAPDPPAFARPPPASGGGIAAFANEPLLDFSLAANRSGFRQAIAAARRCLGAIYPVVYGGREYRSGERLVSTNPADPDEIICTTALLGGQEVDRAVAAARAAQPGWARYPPSRRAALLFRAASLMRRRRFELAARELLEVGKTWAEADADVCEAIDFLEYYGREMIRLGSPLKLGEAPGEDNRYGYRPRGVGLVVAPWNFPLAISMGMVSAALVAGNAVLYKPSSLSPGCGWLVYEILVQAGIPAGVVNFVPGRGSEVGDALVEHPGTDFILFTGSVAVGLGIVEKAGVTRPGQRGPKKVVIETGGKNAIIVDADADLNQAVPGVIQSAFGFQGQKCSACSRVIVLDEVYPGFLGRLAEAVRELPAGNPEDPRHAVGPVIDGAARDHILARIDQGRREGRVLAQGEVPGGGHYVPPTVLVDVPADSSLLRDEIFGPVLAVMRAADMDRAVALANSTAYALTGGLYSRSPANIRKAVAEFAAGNLYINRPITGALVGRQPFGGFKMSGVGSKAGGPDYLQQFMEPRVVTENTLRRGFTPEDVG
jgi:RHH-type proline utilization regulon transcriptional repressor/proline dehydrogenase/delta 1-pyrroline-5-carboxylate dehydrogenase